MSEKKYPTTTTVIAELDRLIEEGYKKRIRAVCNQLSIFDWWREDLSISAMKQMRSFLNTAHKLGFDGYVCFKVGASGCASGMWAHTKESENGYSPNDCDFLYRSFQSKDNYWDVIYADGSHLSDKMDHFDDIKTARQLMAAL